jgi:hypothetical protein
VIPTPVELPKFEVVEEVVVAPKPKYTRPPMPKLVEYADVAKHNPFAGRATLLETKCT